jgi:hypothetical protein
LDARHWNHHVADRAPEPHARKGAVRKRTQLKTKTMGEKHWTKRSKDSGQFMDQKKEGKFKGENESFVSLGPLAERLLPGKGRIAFRQTEATEADNFGRTGNASQPRAS